jgi:hypothetical protein
VASWRSVFRLFGPEFIYREQFDYGHRELLIEYAGLPSQTILRGRIQHGWDPFMSEPVHPYRPAIIREGAQWVWTQSAVDRAQQLGLKRVVAIGAPWLYLLQADLGLPATQSRAGVLAVPGHYNEASTPAYHASFLGIAREAFPDAERIVFLLHGLDFMRSDIRSVYSRAGAIVDCAGWPAGVSPPRSPSADVGDRTKFLANIARLMSASELVATDSIGTHLLYASSLDLPVWLLRMRRDLLQAPSNASVPSPMWPSIRREFAWLDRHLGGFTGQEIEASFLSRLAKEHLGAANLRSPSELRDILQGTRLKT